MRKPLFSPGYCRSLSILALTRWGALKHNLSYVFKESAEKRKSREEQRGGSMFEKSHKKGG